MTAAGLIAGLTVVRARLAALPGSERAPLSVASGLRAAGADMLPCVDTVRPSAGAAVAQGTQGRSWLLHP
jgi:hypothetical protein